jgi:phthalate 4,5-dioxygenase
MLRQEQNELICRVGPDTPEGAVLRRYWLPAFLSEESLAVMLRSTCGCSAKI